MVDQEVHDSELEQLQKELVELEKKKENEDKKQELRMKIADLKKATAPDNAAKRMGRGFKVMFTKLANGYSKVVNNNYVQSIKAEQEGIDAFSTNLSELAPEEEPKRKESSKIMKPKKDPFTTDFHSMADLDF